MGRKLYRPDRKILTPNAAAQNAAATGEALFKAAGTQFLANMLQSGYRVSNPAGEDITDMLLVELVPAEAEEEAA